MNGILLQSIAIIDTLLILPWVKAGSQLVTAWAQATAILVGQLLGRGAEGLLDAFVSRAWRVAMAIASAVMIAYLALSPSFGGLSGVLGRFRQRRNRGVPGTGPAPGGRDAGTATNSGVIVVNAISNAGSVRHDSGEGKTMCGYILRIRRGAGALDLAPRDDRRIRGVRAGVSVEPRPLLRWAHAIPRNAHR